MVRTPPRQGFLISANEERRENFFHDVRVPPREALLISASEAANSSLLIFSSREAERRSPHLGPTIVTQIVAKIKPVLTHYPKLSAILLTYPIAIFLMAAIGPAALHALVEPFGIGGIFIAGALYTYGFTASAALFIIPAFLPDYSPIFIALVAGLGATLADITIFKFMKGNLKKEIQSVARIPAVRRTLNSRILRHPWSRALVGFLVISSPFPDEIGVAFLSMTRMDESTFRIVSFGANILGVYLLASAGTLVY